MHREFSARHFDIRFDILSTTISSLICLRCQTLLIPLPGTFFSMKSMRCFLFLRFGAKTRSLVRENMEKCPDLRVEHELYQHLAWRRVTLEKKWNRIWNQLFSKNKSPDCLPLLVVSLAIAVWSFACYQILNEELNLRRKKPHDYFENGDMMDVQFHFSSSYENFMCYLSALEPFSAGAELFLSRILIK